MSFRTVSRSALSPRSTSISLEDWAIPMRTSMRLLFPGRVLVGAPTERADADVTPLRDTLRRDHDRGRGPRERASPAVGVDDGRVPAGARRDRRGRPRGRRTAPRARRFARGDRRAGRPRAAPGGCGGPPGAGGGRGRIPGGGGDEGGRGRGPSPARGAGSLAHLLRARPRP